MRGNSKSRFESARDASPLDDPDRRIGAFWGLPDIAEVWLPSKLSLLPGIDNQNAGGLEVSDVACDHGQPMCQGSGGNQRVPV